MADSEDEPPRLNRYANYPYAVIPVPYQDILQALPIHRGTFPVGALGAPQPAALEVP